jgi:hypothetical protein
MPLHAGDKIGKLTLVELADERRGKRKGKVWLCRCECGTEMKRTWHSLSNSKAAGSDSSCPDCRPKPAGCKTPTPNLLRRYTINGLRLLWDNYGTLYPSWIEKELEEQIMEDMVEELGPLRNPTLVELELGEHPATLDEPQPMGPPDGFYDEPGPYGDLTIGTFEQEPEPIPEYLKYDPEPLRRILTEDPRPQPPPAAEPPPRRYKPWKLPPRPDESWKKRPPRPWPKPSIMGSGLPLDELQEKMRDVRESLVQKLWPHALQRFVLLTNAAQRYEISRLLEIDGREAG